MPEQVIRKAVERTLNKLKTNEHHDLEFYDEAYLKENHPKVLDFLKANGLYTESPVGRGFFGPSRNAIEIIINELGSEKMSPELENLKKAEVGVSLGHLNLSHEYMKLLQEQLIRPEKHRRSEDWPNREDAADYVYIDLYTNDLSPKGEKLFRRVVDDLLKKKK